MSEVELLLAFLAGVVMGDAIREAVRLEAQREPLAVAPNSAKVIAMKPKLESKVA